MQRFMQADEKLAADLTDDLRILRLLRLQGGPSV